MLKRYLTIIALMCTLPVFGQVRIQFIPEIYGRNVNGLFNVQFINAQEQLAATLTITVTEREAGTLCVVKIPEFNIMPGTNSITPTVARKAAIQFANNKAGRLTGANSTFPAGDYDYCYSLVLKSSDGTPFEECFSYTLAPFADLSLIEPYDNDDVCDKRPMLTWQPLVPAVPGAYYQLVLTEIKRGQNPTEAINYNLPIINQHNIISPILPYPPIARQLEQSKKYAWQVTAYKDQTVLNRSEIWEFNINCPDTTKKVLSDGGYRNIEDLLKGNYYVANGAIHFALVNAYEPQKLKYEVMLVNNPDKKLKGLPRIKLSRGDNKIDIDLSSNGNLVDGDYYLLVLRLPDGAEKTLRFMYRNNNE